MSEEEVKVEVESQADQGPVDPAEENICDSCQ